MKAKRERRDDRWDRGIFAAFNLLLASALATHAALPSDWEKVQDFNITAPGLVKLSLPVETLDAARPALEDLRLYDDAGNETPYFVEHPRPLPNAVRIARSFQVSLNPSTTVLTIETGIDQPVGAVTLDTPAMNFIKAVAVEGSADGNNWQPLARGRPIFQQINGARQTEVSFPPGAWHWLRLTVDDQRSRPIPFTGARVHAATALSTPAESESAAIMERNENPGETRLTLNAGAANLNIAAIDLETTEPLFARRVTVAVPQVAEDGIREQTVGQGLIYRIAIEGQPASANLSIPLETQIRSREIILLIHNEDSPPLPISAARASRRPVYLVFNARQPGKYHLLTGNGRCAAPRYDLAAMSARLQNAPLAKVAISPPLPNPDFRAPEALPGIDLAGAPLDVSAWKFRKPIHLTSDGAQQVELDVETLGRVEPGLSDLRILRGSNQVPYIIERTSISRSLAPEVTATNDTKNPRLSRWRIKTENAGLPLTRLECASATSLFSRQMSLYEELADERGERHRHALGAATWTQTPEHKTAEFSIAFEDRPQSDTLFLETENGDNPPVSLAKFALSYPATRALFKAAAQDELFLYYGNPSAAPPAYDLNLVSGDLLVSDKKSATLSAEQQLRKLSWGESQKPGQGGVLLWTVLAVVVGALLIIIARLLPKAEAAK